MSRTEGLDSVLILNEEDRRQSIQTSLNDLVRPLVAGDGRDVATSFPILGRTLYY